MIGIKLYEKRSRVFLFSALYGILALIGVVTAVREAAQGKPASGEAGFMIVFGAGMCIRGLVRSRRPLVVLQEDRIELNFSNRPVSVRYKEILSSDHQAATRLVLKRRDGHVTRQEVVLLNHLEQHQGTQLVEFLRGKGWSR